MTTIEEMITTKLAELAEMRAGSVVDGMRNLAREFRDTSYAWARAAEAMDRAADAVAGQ
jgi:hypothetical protein